MISGAIAGLSGFLFAVKDGYVNPELLSWHLSGAVLIMIILGGLGHLRGALIGAFAFALLQEFFKSEAIFGSFAKHWLLGLGLAIIAPSRCCRAGWSTCRSRYAHGCLALADRASKRSTMPTPGAAARPRDHPSLGRAGGGQPGLDRARAQGAVHAVIGTNGAGKSTLVNILSGEIEPSEGRVELLGQDVTRWSQPRRARAGLGRSYQLNTIYPSFSVAENCRLAAQAAHQRPWAWWQNAQRCEASTTAGRAAAARAGLERVLDRPAGLLSHGQKPTAVNSDDQLLPAPTDGGSLALETHRP